MNKFWKKNIKEDNKIGETHTRTTAKTITYRIAHMVFLFILAHLFGSGTMGASILVVVVLFLGSLLYYLYDRVWLLFPWHREIETGKDDHIRSIVKSIGYRVLIFFVAIVVFMIVLNFPLSRAIAMAASDVFSAIVIYYVIERVYDFIDWGRKKVEVV